MNLNKGSQVKYNNEIFEVMGKTFMDGKEYAFIKNKSEDKFYAIEVGESKLVLVEDRELIQRLYPAFEAILLNEPVLVDNNDANKRI